MSANDTAKPAATAAVNESDRAISIEAALGATGLVDDCAVLPRATEAGDVLVAYVVGRAHVSFSLGEIDRRVREALGTAFVPASYVELRSMPLTPEGAVDRAALEAIAVIDDDLVSRWEKAWREVPGVDDVVVVAEDDEARRPALHLADLIPGWGGDRDVEAAASGSAAAAAGDETRPWALADGGPLSIPADAPRTLTEGLLRTAEIQGSKVIRFVEPDGSERQLTYRALLDGARRIAGGLRRLGLGPGDRAILQLPDLDEHFPTFWACLLIGVKPVTVAVPSAYEARNAVARKLFNTWTLLEKPPVLAARRLVDAIGGLETVLDMRGVRVVPVDELKDDPPIVEHHESRPEDVAFFQLSSGSTGISKCIQIRHGGVVAHIHAEQQHLGRSSDDVTLNWLPMDHVVPLLQYHVKDVYLGIEQVQVPGPTILGRPLEWLDYIERYRVTHTWAPNFGFKMLADALATAGDRRWDLSSIKGFLNAGEQVTLPVVHDFLARVAPFGAAATTMNPAFGMAEVCTCMTYDVAFSEESSVRRLAKASLGGALRPAAGDEPAVTFVECGPVVPGVQIRIADKSNALVREGTVGRLQIKGAVVTPGYLNNPAANEEAFVGDDWFNTGDLGFIWDGRLTLTGREKELIIVNGANFYCYEIEDVASQVDGVLPTFVAASGIADPATGTEALAVFFVHDEGSGVGLLDVVRRLRTEVAASVGLSPAWVVPIARDEFPKTTSGKIQRGQMKQALVDGKFQQVLKTLDIGLENANTVPDWFYGVEWRRKDVPSSTSRRAAGVRLIFADTEGTGEALARETRARGGRAVIVRPGARYLKVDDARYEIDPAHREDYVVLVKDVQDESGALEAVHLWAASSEAMRAVEPADVEAELVRGLYSVLSLVQALDRVRPTAANELVVVTTGAWKVGEGDAVSPARAAIGGLMATLPSEFHGLASRHVDLPAGTSDARAALLERELGTIAGDREVALREGSRWVRRVARLDLARAPHAAPPFVKGGIYLLTGGLGGLGVEVARHLLQTSQARLLIVGRSHVDRADAADARAVALRALEALPGDVMYEACDVADAPALESALSRARARWSRDLDGVLHLAGVFEERLLVDESPATLAAILRPKVFGALALERLLSDRPDALFLTFSSGYGTFGGFAAGAYSCANAFLDGLAEVQRAHRGARARTIAWGLWDDTGMSRGYGNREAAGARGYQLIARKPGLQSFAAVLAHDVPHVLVGLNEHGRAIRPLVDTSVPAAQSLVAYVVANGPASIAAPSAEIADSFGTSSRCKVERVPAVPRDEAGRVDRRRLQAIARGEDVARVTPRDDLEQAVAVVWQEALGLDAVSVHDNFFELGGTSFLAGQIAGRLRDRLKTDMVSTQMFQFPTIAHQAAFLRGDLDGELEMQGSRSRGEARREGARRLRRAVAGPSSR